MKISTLVMFAVACLCIAGLGWASGTDGEEPPKEILWQAENPTCINPRLPLEGQLEAIRFRVGGEITEPRKTSGRNPTAEERFRMSQARARPVIEFVVGKNGRVQLVVPARELASESDRIMAVVVSEWLFEPATKGGEPVCVSYIVSSSISY